MKIRFAPLSKHSCHILLHIFLDILLIMSENMETKFGKNSDSENFILSRVHHYSVTHIPIWLITINIHWKKFRNRTSLEIGMQGSTRCICSFTHHLNQQMIRKVFILMLASQSEGGIRESVWKPILVAISVENGNMPIVWE